MLFHIRPRLYSPRYSVTLVDLKIEPLGFYLVGGVHLATRRPYPNKRYAVACRKRGHKAMDGILINCDAQPVYELHCTARWAVDASRVVTHHVHYMVIDRDFDAASDSMVMWYAAETAAGRWENRFPDWATGVSPAQAEPFMELIPDVDRVHGEDVIDAQTGWIVSRRQSLSMPSIERARLLTAPYSPRMPTLESAFS